MRSLATLFLILAGCASSQLVLQEQDMAQVDRFGDFSARPLNQPKLNILSLIDDRPNKAMLGLARTGMFDTQTPIVTDPPAADFLKSRLIKILSQRGFNMTDESDFVLEGKIKRLFASERDYLWAMESARCLVEIEFTLRARKSPTAIYGGTMYSEGIRSTTIIDATSSIGPILESCIQTSIDKFIKNPDIARILNIQWPKEF